MADLEESMTTKEMPRGWMPGDHVPGDTVTTEGTIVPIGGPAPGDVIEIGREPSLHDVMERLDHLTKGVELLVQARFPSVAPEPEHVAKGGSFIDPADDPLDEKRPSFERGDNLR